VTVPDTVVFGIPLLAKSLAQDWSRILQQLDATIGSIYAQTDPRFRIVVACTDQPGLRTLTDRRLEFLMVEQLPPMSSRVYIGDAVRKRHRIAQRLRALGGGYLMFTDADDVVSNRLVDFVLRDRNPNGYVVRSGYMFDAGRGLLAPFPFVEDGKAHFDQECGTSAVAAFTPDELPQHESDNRNWFGRLMAFGHPGVWDQGKKEGRPLAEFPFRPVVYVRNTGENVSTREAVTSDLRRIGFQAYLDDGVARTQVPRTAALDAEFNLAAVERRTGARQLGTRRFEPVLGLSILIATHRRPAGLRRLLAALRPQVVERSDRQVIVVNDHSHDDAYAAVATEFADMITYKLLDGEGGIARARNAGLASAAGTYSVFTDDDCEPPPWWLDWLAARLRIHPEIDVAVGVTRPLWETRSFRERLNGEWFLPQPRLVGDRQIFVTANVAIRTDLARSVGGFGLPSFGGAGEDTELSIRLHRHGARFLMDHGWWVAHTVGGSFRALMSRYRRYADANARIERAMAISLPESQRAEEHQSRPLAGRIRLARDSWEAARTFPGNFVERVAAAACAAIVREAYLRAYLSRRRRPFSGLPSA
jgi:GT2 family glycosyltransferase